MSVGTWIGIAAMMLATLGGEDPAEGAGDPLLPGQVVVVVSPVSPVSGIATDELRRLYLGESTKLPDGSAAVLLQSARHSKVFVASLLGMSEDRFKRHWIRVLFAGEAGAPPRMVDDVAELKRLVGSQPGAIGFLDAGHVDATVKVIAVGGRRPGEPGYLFPDVP